MADRLGIFFGLPEDAYHADTALGSTDIKDLFHSPCDWQWKRLHPEEPEKKSHLDIGTSVHELVLLGKESFLKRIEKSPYPDFRKKEAREWRDQVLADGKVILTEDEYEQVIAAAGAILNSPNLRSEFTNGVPEVSIFWEEDGIRMKGRYDYLKIRGVVDLKTFSEKFQQSLLRTVTGTIADRRYDLQACHYQHGRKAMLGLFEKGLVYGDPQPKKDWLEKVCKCENPAWVWVFFKTTGAPVAFSANPMNMRHMWRNAEEDREIAIENYRKFRDKFTDAEIWVEEIEQFVLADEDLPPWMGRR